MRFAALVAGALAALFPFVAGWGVLFSPLCKSRGSQTGGGTDAELDFVRIGPLAMLPADGLPRQFIVTTDVADAWARSKNQRVGSVFLSRDDSTDGPQVHALSAACPHLGCAVDFNESADKFECPCHVSGFAADGQKLFGPSLRGLDPLPVKLIDRDGELEIWIAYERFRAGVAERIEIG